jgi:hypothetical protein
MNNINLIYSDEGFWKNDFGWVFLMKDATRFTDAEREIYNLPLGNCVKWTDCNLESNTFFSPFRYNMNHDNRKHNGKSFKLIRQMTEDLDDKYFEEDGIMFKIKLEDGCEINAFINEINNVYERVFKIKERA